MEETSGQKKQGVRNPYLVTVYNQKAKLLLLHSLYQVPSACFCTRFVLVSVEKVNDTFIYLFFSNMGVNFYEVIKTCTSQPLNQINSKLPHIW